MAALSAQHFRKEPVIGEAMTSASVVPDATSSAVDGKTANSPETARRARSTETGFGWWPSLGRATHDTWRDALLAP